MAPVGVPRRAQQWFLKAHQDRDLGRYQRLQLVPYLVCIQWTEIPLDEFLKLAMPDQHLAVLRQQLELRIPAKAATDSDPKRPLWPEVEFGVVIVAVGCSLGVIFVRRVQRRWR